MRLHFTPSHILNFILFIVIYFISSIGSDRSVKSPNVSATEKPPIPKVHATKKPITNKTDTTPKKPAEKPKSSKVNVV